ncbi:lasso peptide biosynthesis B2 protein [Parasphingorhabdus sp.]|uniref:lasso peptide biosynthesis B2 protein n=1 Tax=Parasphingorhabdus sp. TaxID=2709688 RepID=UPI0032EE048E
MTYSAQKKAQRSVHKNRLYQYWLLAKIWLCLIVIHIAVQGFGLQKVRRKLSLGISRQTTGQLPVEDAALVAAYMGLRVRTIKRRFPNMLNGNCLSQSLALWWLLARKGIATTLHIGAHRKEGEFKAHAWVELDGEPINARRLIRGKYQTFDHDFISPLHG